MKKLYFIRGGFERQGYIVGTVESAAENSIEKDYNTFPSLQKDREGVSVSIEELDFITPRFDLTESGWEQYRVNPRSRKVEPTAGIVPDLPRVGPQGEQGPPGEPGSDGKSAYDLWLAAGNSGTQADFLASLKGSKGDAGATGSTGSIGPTGKDGSTGKSAYQIWLDAGNKGTEADFLASLKGSKGDTGADGKSGTDATVGLDGYKFYIYTGTTDANGVVTIPYGRTFADIKAVIPSNQANVTNAADVPTTNIKEQHLDRCVIQAVKGVAGSLLGLTSTFRFASGVKVTLLVIAK